MTGEAALQNIAEISITLAGLSGIAAALRSSRIEHWPPRERLAFWLVLSTSLAAFFGSLIPPALVFLGIAEDSAWSVSCLILSLALLASISGALAQNRRLVRAGDHSPTPLVWRLLVPYLAVVATLLILSTWGVLLRSGLGIYYVGLVSFLVVACTAFVLFLRYPAAALR